MGAGKHALSGATRAATPGWPIVLEPPSQGFGLRYATHLGFRDPERPLFREHVGSIDPAAHVRLAAELGFAGVMHPWALAYPQAEITAFAQAAADCGIEGSCVVFAPREVITRPLWGIPGDQARSTILRHMDQGCRLARQIRSKTVAVIATADPAQSFADQRAAMAGHLAAAGDAALAHGIAIVIETMRTLPDMLLRDMHELIAIVREVDHPAVKIAFDTHHCAALNGVDNVLPLFCEAYDDIGVLQLASFPEKTEPGTGEIDFIPLLAEAIDRGFEPLVELEHVWSEPGLDGERSGFERFVRIDAAAHPSTQ